MWSQLSIRLRFVSEGKMWFKFRVNADNSPQAVDDCPWLKGNTGVSPPFLVSRSCFLHAVVIHARSIAGQQPDRLAQHPPSACAAVVLRQHGQPFQQPWAVTVTG